MNDDSKYVYIILETGYRGECHYTSFVGVYSSLEVAKQVTVAIYHADEWREAKSTEGHDSWIVPTHSLLLAEIIRAPIYSTVQFDGPPST